LRLPAPDLYDLRAIDEIIAEPPGGAHADHVAAGKALQETLLRQLDELRGLKPDKLVRRRREKYLRMGQYTE
ncbi:MAG: acetyl-CoA carboxylase carboxyl transferase subunit alpha, partial [Gemmatimonadales bacterium]